MSTFGGQMLEYNSISIDRFDGNNLNSSMFMLSHNHKDHTVGLSSGEFQYRLQNNSALKLYCSAITRDLLLLEDCYAAIWDSIVPLDVDCPHVLDIPDIATGKVKKTVVVTLLQAGHCPGSVMFLFEGDEGTVLYTGDFRLTKEDISSFTHLHASDGSVKEIKSIYIDTTFCVPKAFFIPSREDCIEAAIEIVQDWISRGQEHLILLSYKANIGYERLFVCLSEKFGVKIHVHKSKYEQYKKIENLGDYMTSNPAETQIHACRWTPEQRNTGSLLPCGYGGNSSIKVRTIVLSTMCFVHTVGLELYSKRFSETFFRVCYSFHSSFSEIRDMVLYLTPDQAFPNVIPIYDSPSLDQVQKRLNGFVKLAKKTRQSALHLSSGQFGLLKSPKGRKRQQFSQHSHSSGSSKLIFNEDDQESSAPKKTKLVDASTPPTADDSKTEKSDFPLLFGSQDSSGSVSAVPNSPASDLRVGNTQMEGDLDKSVVTDENLDESQDELTTSEESSAEERGLSQHLSDADLVMSYISEDDCGHNWRSDAIARDQANLESREESCVPSSTDRELHLSSESVNVVDYDQKTDLKGEAELNVESNLAVNSQRSGGNNLPLPSSDASQDSHFSDVIIVDDNAIVETVNLNCDQLNEANGCLNSSRTADSDITVDIGCSPYKLCSGQSVTSSVNNPSVRADDFIDLTADDEIVSPNIDARKNNGPSISSVHENRNGKNRERNFNSDFDSLSDDYDGDDEFEEANDESGYDSDAEIINSRKCSFENVIKERALRYSRTAISSSDIIVIDDDDLSESGLNRRKRRLHDVRYCSTESTSSSSSTESLISNDSQELLLNRNIMFFKNSGDNLLLNSSGKPRLWLPESLGSLPGIVLGSSEDLYSS